MTPEWGGQLLWERSLEILHLGPGDEHLRPPTGIHPPIVRPSASILPPSTLPTLPISTPPNTYDESPSHLMAFQFFPAVSILSGSAWVPPAATAYRPVVDCGSASVAAVRRRRHNRPAGNRRWGVGPLLPTSRPALSGAPPLCMAAPLPPRNIGGTTKALKAALQAALQSRLSRMVVELPVGARYGVEKASVDGSDDTSAGAGAAPTAASVAVSDRELARLVVAMFAGNGLGIVALFRDASAAAAATKAWRGGASSDCTVTSWDAVGASGDRGSDGLAKKRKNAKAGARKGGGFGAPPPPTPVKPAPALYGPGTDLVLVVAPGPSQLARLARLSDEAGPGTVLVILNGRLDSAAHPSPVLRDHFTGDASPWMRVLLFRPGPHPGWAGGVLYRQFPEPYVLCRKARLGPPVRLAEFPDAPPSLDEIDAALRAASEAEGGPGGEGGVLGRVARLFRGE